MSRVSAAGTVASGALALSGCVPTNPAHAPPGPLSLSIRPEPAATNEAIEPTSLMNPGDEVDDNIWTRRPRNRLQPGQSVAPESPTRPREALASRQGAVETPASSQGPTPADGGTVPSGSLAALGDDGLDAAPGPSAPAAGASASGSARIPAPAPAASGTPLPSPVAPNAPAGTAPRATADAAPAAPAPKSSGGAEGQPIWSIALATFSGDEHRATAESAARLFAQQVPELREAFVRSTPSGSVVLWGEFDGPKDPRARPELDRLKLVMLGEGRPFAKAMLVRLEQFSEQELHPWDLRQVRLRYPRVRVIYTLQVAAWSDLGSGSLTFEQIRTSAEAYCRQLRAEGAEAFFHHDADLKTSIVTVGVFDHRAYDPQSTLFAPEVEVLRRRYPTSLLNGAELIIAPDPNRPELTVPQPSRLVEVPR